MARPSWEREAMGLEVNCVRFQLESAESCPKKVLPIKVEAQEGSPKGWGYSMPKPRLRSLATRARGNGQWGTLLTAIA